MLRFASVAVGIAATLALAACGSTPPAASAGATGAASSPATTAAVSPAATTGAVATIAPLPSGPATLQLTVTAEPPVTGAWQAGSGVNCSNPTLAGLNILAFATAPDGQSVLVLTFTSGLVTVSERTGSNTTYTAREFKGTGVTAFDPARGVTFDTDLEVVPTPTINPGTLGLIKHVAGSVDCAGQTVGTSTVVATGSSAEGTVEGQFTHFRVVCNESAANGPSANIIGVIETASPRVYLIIGLPENGNATIFSITENPQKQHSYVFDRSATSTWTITGTSVHIEANFIEVVEANATPHSIHLSGDATCGTVIKSA